MSSFAHRPDAVKPGGPISDAERRMRVDALLNGQELGGDVVDARRDGPLVRLGRKQCIQPSARSCRVARDPQVVVPREVKSVGNILKGLGRAITGRQGPLATDADCGALSRRAIGR